MCVNHRLEKVVSSTGGCAVPFRASRVQRSLRSLVELPLNILLVLSTQALPLDYCRLLLKVPW